MENRQGLDPRQPGSGACTLKHCAVLGNWVDIVALIRIENGGKGSRRIEGIKGKYEFNYGHINF